MNEKPRRLAPPALKAVLVALCLFAPSLWMITHIPPLWRDADAYTQLTEDPLVATYWGHAPAYCHLSKIPLFLGERIERIRGNTAVTTNPPVSWLPLTDTGIWLLIISQHLALAVGVCGFIFAVSGRFWMRLFCAAIWASTALFYTFAHCVGSESLGMILIVFLAWRGLRLVQTDREPTWKEWYGYVIVLLLCILARDLNLALLALLPATFLIASTVAMFARDPSAARLSLRYAVIAVAVGIACFATAKSVPRELARKKTNLQPHSRIGFTFLWRLQSLSELSPETRTALLQRVTARTPPGPVRGLIALVGQTNAFDPVAFMKQAVELFGGPPHWKELNHGLNQMALAFLWPPAPEITSAARADFATAMRLPSTLIVEYLFATTSFYFHHQADMPACVNLATFRGMNSETIVQMPGKHRYFHWWRDVSYGQAFVFWSVSFVFVVVLVCRRKSPIASLCFAISLAGAGLLIFAVSCLLHNYEPRFGLTMWQALLLSWFVLAGRAADLLLGEVRRAAAVAPKPRGLPKAGLSPGGLAN